MATVGLLSSLLNSYLSNEAKLNTSIDLVVVLLDLHRPLALSSAQLETHKIVVTKWVAKVTGFLQSGLAETRLSGCRLVQSMMAQSALIFAKTATSWVTHLTLMLKVRGSVTPISGSLSCDWGIYCQCSYSICSLFA